MSNPYFCVMVIDIWNKQNFAYSYLICFILFYLTVVILLYSYEGETIETCNRISLPREIGFSWGYALRELIYILAFYVGEAESVIWWILDLSLWLALEILVLMLWKRLQMPLPNLPKTFGLDLSMYSKGDFPHIFNCLENQNYIGPFATFRIFFSGNSFKVGLPNICMVVQENLIQKVPLSC